VSDRKPYKCDLSDERWALIEPVITAWKAWHSSVSGHGGRYEMREIVNALLYQSRTGCQWDYLPHDLPPSGAVKYYFYKWRDDGLTRSCTTCCAGRSVMRRAGQPTPGLMVLDTRHACRRRLTRRRECLSRRGRRHRRRRPVLLLFPTPGRG
jgi:transposase